MTTSTRLITMSAIALGMALAPTSDVKAETLYIFENTTLIGGEYDDIVVFSGYLRLREGAVVHGNVTVLWDGSASTTDSTIEGKFFAWGADEVLFSSAVVGGNITQFASEGPFRIRESMVSGDVTLLANRQDFIDIKTNGIDGRVTVTYNKASDFIFFGGNVVDGTVKFSLNKTVSDDFKVWNNEIDGNLYCWWNWPDPDLQGNDVTGTIRCY